MVRNNGLSSIPLIRLQSFTSIIWPVDFWKVIDAKQTVIAQDFAKQMKSTLKAEYEEISFEDIWLKYPPTEADGQSLPDFINGVCETNRGVCTLISTY